MKTETRKNNLRRSSMLGGRAFVLVIVLVFSLLATGALLAGTEGNSSGALLVAGGKYRQGDMTLLAAFGQPVAGHVDSSGLALCSGMLCFVADTPSPADNWNQGWLPIIVR